MLYLTLAGLMLYFAILCFYRSNVLFKKDDRGHGNYLVGGIALLFTATIIVGITLSVFVHWQAVQQRFSYLDTMVGNKLTKIEMMKQSYREIATASEVNVDMVNKDLTQEIASQIQDLEVYVNRYNLELYKWTMCYRYRFWTSCFTPPSREKPYELTEWVTLSKPMGE